MRDLTVENVYIRHQAKELVRRHFWKLLGMALIVCALMYLVWAGGLALLTLLPGANTTVTTSATYVGANVSGTGVAFTLAFIALFLIVALLGCGLTLGLTSALLSLCRGEDVTVGSVFSRMNQCLKAVGLALWVSLKTYLWALPAYALVIVALLVPNKTVLALLPIVSVVVMIALVAPAALRYMLSTYILADKPDTGVFECVRQSKALMQGRKWQAFKLPVPPLLALYGLMLVIILAFSLLTSLLVSTSVAVVAVASIVMILAVLALALYFGLRVALGYCLFYLKLTSTINGFAEAFEDDAPQAE